MISWRLQIAFVILGVAVCLHECLGVCPERMFGHGCVLECHCMAGAVCDENGLCANCSEGWNGPTCQIETKNVALNKATQQMPTTKTGMTSDLAVDGDLATYSWVQNRMAPDVENGSVWWVVDLGQTENIHTVKIHFYSPDPVDDAVLKRRQGVGVSIANDSLLSIDEWCHIQRSDWETDDVVSLTDCNKPGTHVFVFNERYNSSNQGNWSKLSNLELAEVQVLVEECSDGTYGQNCELQCGYCVNQVCLRDGNCTDGCLIGWYGTKCDKNCSDTCLNSSCDSDGHCSEGCIDLHLGEYCNQTCEQTIPGCSVCIVEAGKFVCNDSCSAKCETCGPPCTKCYDGFFLSGGRCDSCSIIDNCLKCLSPLNCSECKPGYFSVTGCNECPTHCSECTSASNCTVCETGWQGERCQCGPNCIQNGTINDWCNVNGRCKLGCVDGKMDDDCMGNCSKNCEQCDQNTGLCLRCKNGFYNKTDQCEQRCGYCMDNRCDEVDGKCATECTDGFHGPRCDQQCSIHCDPNICDKDTGACEKCSPGYYGKACEHPCSQNCEGGCMKAAGSCIDCKMGYYGDKCEKICNKGCGTRTCNKVGGECTYGCQDGLYGDYCERNCSQNCPLICHRSTGHCDGCNPNRHGNFCEKICSPRCGPRLQGSSIMCHQHSGQCNFCKHGYYGDYCEYNCSSSCALMIGVSKPDCYRVDGNCKKCRPGDYGLLCTESCSVHCSQGTCSQKSGVCDIDCEPGWYNGTCELPCNVGCKEDQCDRYTAKCLSGCKERYSGEWCENEEAASVILYVVLAVVSVLLLVIITLIICFVRRRKSRPYRRAGNGDVAHGRAQNGRTEEVISLLSNGSRTSQPTLPARHSKKSMLSEEEAVDIDETELLVRKSEPSDYYNLSSCIAVAEFSEYLRRRRNEDIDWYKIEFKKLPTGLLKDVNDSLTPGNRGRCRYKNLYPYDWNRVKLEPEADSKHDFINASYLYGYNSPQAFIAAQGPTENTLGDYWRMIWQNNCGRIVMLTNLFEECKMKCICYWPDENEPQMFSVYEVSLEREDVMPNYTIRHLKATHTKTKEVKEFKQYHYTTWPDRNVPDNPGFLLAFRDKVMGDTESLDGPILVHCSAGIGRTGTFIALDYLVKQAQTEKYIDVFRTVTDMRYQRTNFVQTDIQYGFLHTAINEALTTKEMEIASSEFCQYFWSLEKNNWQALREQFQSLNETTPVIDVSSFAMGQVEENIHKNRHPSILPLDMHRAYLSTPVKGSNDYINAVFLPSCTNKTGFLLTQMPLPTTVTDFWRLVYDHHVCNIVMLNNLNEEDETIGEYWPNGDAVYGPFTIELMSTEKGDNYTAMNFQLTHKSLSRETKMKVKLFQYEGWPEGEVTPVSAKSLTSIISTVSRSSRDSTSEPVIVHCMDGAERSGLYTVLAAVLEMLQIEQKVNIPHVLLQQRSRRPQLIQTFEQYVFLYSAVADYIEATQIYSNVL